MVANSPSTPCSNQSKKARVGPLRSNGGVGGVDPPPQPATQSAEGTMQLSRGGIAQLGEHLLCKQRVAGSSPAVSTRSSANAEASES